MTTRKQITDLALNFFSNGILLVHPKDIKRIDQLPSELKTISDNCYIYLIVKRPRISFIPGSIVVAKDKTSGRFKYMRHGVANESEFYFTGNANAYRVEISEYPHTKMFLIRDGEIVFTLPAHLASMKCDHIADESIRDLEVQYVGISYADGKRSAKDRLRSHSTLQQVLSDLNQDSPDSEVLVVLVEYEPPKTWITIYPKDKALRIADDRNVGLDLQRQAMEITKNLQIALVEAGLIKYFEPAYNNIYKKRFPHPNQKILDEVYSIDFSALTVEINTEEINARLFSSAREAGFHHIASFDLHDPSVRQSFFNIMSIETGPDASDFSGPVY